MCDHDWVNLAMADNSIVANFLLRLNNHPQPPPPPPSLQLHWTIRQPRSRFVPKPESSTRASPTTPLSWSAATSASEESNLPAKLTETSRSKVTANPKETVTTRNSKRKKTLAQLKEEENLLLKERINLKNELASLRLTVEKERAANESLKRMKLDLESRQNSNTSNTSLKVQEIGKQEPEFVLPDLNLLAKEDLGY